MKVVATSQNLVSSTSYFLACHFYWFFIFTTEDLSSSHAYLPYLSQGSVAIVILTSTRSTYFPKKF